MWLRCSPCHLFWSDVFDMRRDVPNMPERICYAAASVAIELVLDWQQLCCAARNRLFEHRIGILNVKIDVNRRAAARLWALPVREIGILFGQHERRVADLKLGVSNCAVLVNNPLELCRAKRLAVKLERRCCIPGNQVRCCGMVARRDVTNP